MGVLVYDTLCAEFFQMALRCRGIPPMQGFLCLGRWGEVLPLAENLLIFQPLARKIPTSRLPHQRFIPPTKFDFSLYSIFTECCF